MMVFMLLSSLIDGLERVMRASNQSRRGFGDAHRSFGGECHDILRGGPLDAGTRCQRIARDDRG
jgi:hypothetical protein